MANKYSKSNFVQDNEKKEQVHSYGKEYDEYRKRLNVTAKIMAVVVAMAMIVTTFLAAGVFFWD